jgi:hypothetical protein
LGMQFTHFAVWQRECGAIRSEKEGAKRRVEKRDSNGLLLCISERT